MPSIQIAPDLKLPLDLATRRAGLFGMPGSGKSNLGRVIAEGLAAHGVPFIFIDPEGSAWGIRASFDGKHPGISIPIFGGTHADVPLEAGGGMLMAEIIVADRLSCIVDLEDFSGREKAHFLSDMGERLLRINREPLHLILEEADEYIPQRAYKGQERMLGAWSSIVGRGRKKGLGATAISTRPAKLNTDVRNLLDVLYVFRTTGTHDRKAILDWIKHKALDPALMDTVPSLNDGEAWVWSPQWLKIIKRVKVQRQWTFDSGATPEVTRKARPAAMLADVDLEAIRQRMAATIERAKADDPTALRAEVVALKAKLARATVVQAPPRIEVREVVREVPVLQTSDLDALIQVAEQAGQVGRDLEARIKETVSEIAKRAALAHAHAAEAALNRPRPMPTPTLMTIGPPVAGPSPLNSEKGVARIVALLIQHGSCTRDQLSVLTGFKRSTRDTYIRRGSDAGIIEVRGQDIFPTDQARASSTAAPLPTGSALLAWWFAKLPKGEGQILRILVDDHPSWVTRDSISERTNFARSSRDTYLRRLRSRRLIETDRDGVRANDMLFD